MTKTLILIRFFGLFVGLLAITFGCKSESASEGDVAFLGGEIVNPKNNNVIL